MGVRKCLECNLEISDQEIVCPHCGYMLQTKQEVPEVMPAQNKQTIITVTKVVAVVVVLWMVYFFGSPRTVTWCCYHDVQAATCTEPEYCLRCGKTWGEATGHHWKEATCTEPMTCTICGEIEVAATGHDWIKATCTEPYTCATCGVTDGYPKGHTWEVTTCLEPTICTVCGVTAPAAAGHDWNEATCTTAKKCNYCGKQKGMALGHNAVDYICTRCGISIIEKQDVPDVLDITSMKYSLYTDGSVSIYAVFRNRMLTKTISNITMELEFQNESGEILCDTVTNNTSVTLQCTEKLRTGQFSTTQEWQSCFRNSEFCGKLNIKEIAIEYSDGSRLVLEGLVAEYAVVNWRYQFDLYDSGLSELYDIYG